MNYKERADLNLAIWKAANIARVAAGKRGMVFADFRAFMKEFEERAVSFNAIVADSIAAMEEAERADHIEADAAALVAALIDP